MYSTQHPIQPMHLVIDLQGAQGASRFRGIGRYAESLALALARLAKDHHRVSLALNAAFIDSIDPIREAFSGLVPEQDIHVWQPLSPCNAHDPRNAWRREASETLYKAFIHSLHADIFRGT